MATAFQRNAFQNSAFQIDDVEVVTHLHGRPPRRRGKVGVLDKRWQEALEAAAAIREQLEAPKPKVAALKEHTQEILGIAQEAEHIALIGLVKSLTALMNKVATERKARVKAAELIARIEQELEDEDEAILLLLS